MSEEKKDLENNVLTDEQVEQVSGGISRSSISRQHNVEKDSTTTPENGTRMGPTVGAIKKPVGFV